MKTIKQLIEELLAYPTDYFVYAYEGEGTGIAIKDKDKEHAGWIDLEPD